MFIIRTLIHPFGDEKQERLIREIKVANTGERTMLGGYLYEVKVPKLGQPKLIHDRNDGDLVLAVKTIKLIQEQKGKFPKDEA